MALIVGAVVSAAVVCVGMGLVFVPAGVIVAGLFGLVGCWSVAYVKAKGTVREAP